MHVIIRSLYTSVLYFVVLGPSLFLVNVAKWQLQKKSKLPFIVFSFFAVMIPSIFSGLRGETVGVDLLVYARPMYDIAANTSSLTSLLQLDIRFELGYRVIAYIAAHIFHSFNAHLFLTQLLIVIPIYSGAIILRRYYEPWVVMLSFYCMFFVETFNIMRQGIAVAFVFLAFACFIERRLVAAAVVSFIGFFFHASILVGCVLLIFIYIYSRIKSKRLRIYMLIGITLGVPIALKYWSVALTFLTSHGIISERYSYYVDSMQGGTAYFTRLGMTNCFELAFRWIGVFVPFLLKPDILRKRTKLSTVLEASDQKNLIHSLSGENMMQLNNMMFIGVLLATLIYTSVFVFLHSSYGYRVSFYLEILFILWLPSVYQGVQGQKPTTLNIRVKENDILLFIILFMCFYGGYMVLGFHRTLPFYFQIY